MCASPITLEGRFVHLEPLAAHHAEGLHAAAEPALFEFTPQAPPEWSVEGFRRDIEHINGLDGVIAFAILHGPTHMVIGRTTYMDIQPRNRGLEIGRTWIARAHHGSAVNPEMKLLMLQHAFEALRAIRVQFTTGHTNLHSQRAIAKLGAVREGVRRQDRILPDGRRRDTVVFSIVDGEWPALKARLESRLSVLTASLAASARINAKPPAGAGG